MFSDSSEKGGEVRTIIENKKEKKEVADKEVAEGWYEVSKELNLNAEGSLAAWKNGWNHEENLMRKDLPFDKPRAQLGIWVKNFEEVEKKKRKIISTEEIVKWWEHRGETGLKSKESAEAWGDGWDYGEIERRLGTIIPDANWEEVKESSNIPVNQERTLAQEKERAKMKLIKFSWAFAISEEEEERLKPVYKSGINKATKTEEVRELSTDYSKKIAYDQIKCALVDFLPPLKESDLSPDSQSYIRELINDSVSSKVKDVKSAKWARNSVLKNIREIKQDLKLKKNLREAFVERINTALKLIENNNWKISLEKIDGKEWIEVLNIPNESGEIYQKVSGDLLAKLKDKIKKVDNEGKPWSQELSSEELKSLARSFLYDKINYAFRSYSQTEVAGEEEVEIIMVESVVAAVKKLAISKLKKQIEEKINLAKEINEREEKTDDEIKELIGELDSFTKWSREKDGSNQKEAIRDREKELYTYLELLRYEFYLSIIQKAEKVSRIDEIEKEMGDNMKWGNLPPGRKISDLHQALNNQKALINLKEIVNNKVIPTEIKEINEQLEQLNKLRIQATKAEKNAYEELKEEASAKELELMKAKHQQVNDGGEKWEFDLTEEHKELIENAKNKDKLLTNLGTIEKNFQFRSDFYKVAGINHSPENNQLIDDYQKIKELSGEKAGSVYEENGWKDPSKINEKGFASLDGENYLYDVRNTSLLQAEAIKELQEKIAAARKEADNDNATSEERVAWLKVLEGFNEEWVEKGQDELTKDARREALKKEGNNLKLVLERLSKNEIQSIWDDMFNKNEHGKDPTKLEELVGERINSLDDNYADKQNRNKNSLNKVKETLKNHLKFRIDFLETIGDEGEKFEDEFIYNYQNKGLVERTRILLFSCQQNYSKASRGGSSRRGED
jgi:hypothetical protein